MSETDKYAGFRVLLRKCIGSRTQSEFAKECGISQEHVSRMLNSAGLSRPSRETLEKIASHASGNVDLEQLFVSCGYPPEDAGKTDVEKRWGMSDDDRIWHSIRDFKTGFKALTARPRLWRDLMEFVDAFEEIYGVEDIHTEIGQELPYPGEARRLTECCAPLTFKVSTNRYCSTIYAVVFYSWTKGGSVLVSDVAFDGATLLAAGVFVDRVERALEKRGSGASPLDISVICETKYLDKTEFAGDGAAHADGELVPCINEGFGFAVDGIYDDVLLSFLENHRDSFCVDNDRSDMVNAALSGVSLDEAFALFVFGEGEYAGGGKCAVIPAIMSAEANVDFVLLGGDESAVSPWNRPCVVVRGLDARGEINDLYHSVIQRYAKELRVPRYGVCRYVTCRAPRVGEVYEIEFEIRGEMNE